MKDQIDELFKNIKAHIDTHEPSINHHTHFLNQLHKNKLIKPNQNQKFIVFKHLRPILSIAASIALVLGFFVGLSSDANSMELSKVSKEMAHTEDYFKVAIELELEKLNSSDDPQVKIILRSVLSKLIVLENDYNSLKNDLVNSGTDKRVINAMVKNLQNRIDLLKNVQIQIEELK